MLGAITQIVVGQNPGQIEFGQRVDFTRRIDATRALEGAAIDDDFIFELVPRPRAPLRVIELGENAVGCAHQIARQIEGATDAGRSGDQNIVRTNVSIPASSGLIGRWSDLHQVDDPRAPRIDP